MSAVLQCLIHCPPLQSYFLKQIGHNHFATSMYLSSDRALKTQDVPSASSSGNLFATAPNEICLASELDKVFLSYYGSSVGVDVLSVLAMDDAASMPANASVYVSGPVETVKGEPLVLADMLTAVWRCGGMSHLAGYDQRDAHEFLHGFLEILGYAFAVDYLHECCVLIECSPTSFQAESMQSSIANGCIVALTSHAPQIQFYLS
jgi:Ubiquitin carboxyl-terminal hydrolase